jgi:hypothetical protein
VIFNVQGEWQKQIFTPNKISQFFFVTLKIDIYFLKLMQNLLASVRSIKFGIIYLYFLNKRIKTNIFFTLHLLPLSLCVKDHLCRFRKKVGAVLPLQQTNDFVPTHLSILISVDLVDPSVPSFLLTWLTHQFPHFCWPGWPTSSLISVDLVDPSVPSFLLTWLTHQFPHFCWVFIYCWTYSRPKYIWNIATQ